MVFDNPSDIARFNARVQRGGPDDCWPWTGCKIDGYGYFRLACGVQRRAHRLALAAVHPVPDSLQVLHSCDRPLCCNPRHLRLGTNADNMRDKMVRGRAPKPAAKLTAEIVRIIRALRGVLSASDAASIYGVTPAAIYQVWSGRTWRDV